MSGPSNSDVIVIGAGHNGLVAAFYLARAGHNVIVLEAKPHTGGACLTEELIPGFRFSTCASFLQALRPEIVRDMQLPARGLDIQTQQLASHIYPDGRRIIFQKDSSKTQQDIAKFSNSDAENYPRWTNFMTQVSRVLGPYIMKPPVPLSTIFADHRGSESEQVLNLLVTHSLGEIGDLFFESDEVCASLTSPLDAGTYRNVGSGLGFAILMAMRYYAGEAGLPVAGFPRGGMGTLSSAMETALRAEGAEIRVNNPVQEILVSKGRATGVRLISGEVITGRAIVSNTDPKRTFLNLVDPTVLDSGFLRSIHALRMNHGCLKFHAAVSEIPKYYAMEGMDPVDVAGGAIRICPSRAYLDLSWDDAADGKLPRAPQIEIFTPSVGDDSLAPPGKHTISCWIEYAPYQLRNGDWETRREEMADRIIDIVDAYSPNFKSSIIDYRLLTPLDFEQDRLLTGGNIHQVDIVPSQLLDRRPLPELAQYRAPIEGLYLCGAGMHPWGEVTGAPGHNAAHVVMTDLIKTA